LTSARASASARERGLRRPWRWTLALALTAGCLGSPGPDDLSVVCERKATSPGPAYDIRELDSRTTVRTAGRGTTDDEKGAMLAVAASRVVTMGREPYASFEATLQPYFEPVWLFHAWGNGTRLNASASDEFVVLVRLDDQAHATPTEPDVRAPASLANGAWAAVNRTPEAAAAVGARALGNATWNPALAGCVRLAFEGGASVVVNVDQARVVALA
jgi:hypothetical protein